MIKRIYIYLVLILSVAACSKTETSPTVNPGQERQTINFRPVVCGNEDALRGTVLLEDRLPEGGSFGVLGFHCPGGIWQGTETPRYMYNTRMNHTGDYSEPSQMKYWPVGGMRFMAYYPYSAQDASGNGVVLSGVDASGFPFITYTASEDPARQIDLLGYMTPDVLSKTTGRIPLLFRHLLTRITFSARASAESKNTIVVTRVRLMHVYPGSTFTFDQTSGPDDQQGSWSSQMLGERMTFTVFNGELGVGQKIQVITDASQSLMLVPQALNGITIQVDYTINSTNFSKVIDLEHTSDTSPWIPGRSINYQLEISPTTASVMTVISAKWNQIPIDTDLQ